MTGVQTCALPIYPFAGGIDMRIKTWVAPADWRLVANFKASLNNGAKLKFGAKVVRKTKEKEIDFYVHSDKSSSVTSNHGDSSQSPRLSLISTALTLK